MSISYKVLPQKNLQNLEGANHYYAKAVATGVTDLDRIASIISNFCTVTEADCYAVLKALEHVMPMELSEGRIVKLDGLGNFQISISSKGDEDETAINNESITSNRILFRPGIKFRNLLKSVTYKKITI